jgi:hypothetical protein
MIVNQERTVAQLAEQEKNTQAEQDNRRRLAKSAEEEHTKRLEELQNFAERMSSNEYELDTTFQEQEKELIFIEERLHRNKKELFELRLQESKYALDLTQNRLFIERAHLDLLRNHLRT